MNPILRRVREVIKDSGLSQNALERAELGTQAMFSKWARLDDAEPSSGALARLVTYFGVNGHWLLTGEGEKHTAASGADAVYHRGYVEGLAKAVEAVRALRATSTVADTDLEAEHLLKRQKQGKAPPARPKRPPGRRAAGGG